MTTLDEYELGYRDGWRAMQLWGRLGSDLASLGSNLYADGYRAGFRDARDHYYTDEGGDNGCED